MGEIWWGVLEHDWSEGRFKESVVFLSRELARNKPNAMSDLLFVRLVNDEAVLVTRKDWQKGIVVKSFESPYVVSSLGEDKVRTFLSERRSLPDSYYHQKANTIEAILVRLEQQLQLQQAIELERAAAKSAHEIRLKTKGLAFLGYREAFHHRIAHCYDCKSALSSTIFPECKSCGWMICKCGACGCGYQQAPQSLFW